MFADGINLYIEYIARRSAAGRRRAVRPKGLSAPRHWDFCLEARSRGGNPVGIQALVAVDVALNVSDAKRDGGSGGAQA